MGIFDKLTGKAPAQLPGQAPVVHGPMQAVPCPHCGKPNDFRALHEQQLMDTGNDAACDHCGNHMKIVRIAPVTMVSVRKTGATSINRGAAAQPAQPARTLSPAEARRLLKGR